MHGEKERWELFKKAAFCFEQILKATLHKTTAVGPLASYLKNQVRQREYAGYFWRNKDKLISDVLLWTLAHGHASIG